MSPNKRTPASRRTQLAADRGFRSHHEQAKYGAHVTNRAAHDALPAPAARARNATLQAISDARRHGVAFEDAARHRGVTPEAAAWWSEGVVHRQGGQWAVKPGDRLYRAMYAYSDGRVVELDVRGSCVASRVSAQHDAVQHYLHNNGDTSRLDAMDGARVGGYDLDADPDLIDEMARRGDFDFESIYRLADQ